MVKCKTGKPCGNICIPKKSVCRRENLSSPEARPSVGRSPTQSPKNNHLGAAILAGAGVLGVSTSAYLAAREKYRENIPESAKIAFNKAKNIEVPDIPEDKHQITFTTGGFYGNYGDAEARKGEDYLHHKLTTEVLDDSHHAVKHRNLEFNLEENPFITKADPKNPNPQKADPITSAKEIASVVINYHKKILEPVFKHGRNPEAINLAAEAYAYHKKYPHKEINLVGHSAGGMVNHEAAEILNRMGVKVKVVNLGSGYYGFTNKVGESHTIRDRGDAYLKMVPSRDAVDVGAEDFSSDKHQLKHYMRSDEVKQKLRELLNKAHKKDSEFRSQRGYPTSGDIGGFPQYHTGSSVGYWRTRSGNFDSVKCKTGKPCGKICIPKKSVCRVNQVSLNVPRGRPFEANKGDRPNYETNPDTKKPYTIRELRKIASEKGVYNYGSMTIDQLKQSLAATEEEDLEQRDRIRKTLERNPGLLGKIQRSRVYGNSKPEKAFSDLIKTWNKLNRLTGLVSQLPPQVGPVAVGAFLLGVTSKAYERFTDEYKKQIAQSALAAEARAAGIPVERVGRRNITFVVGGFKSNGEDAQRIRNILEEDNPLTRENHYINFDNKTTDFETNIPKKNPDGSYSLAYLGQLSLHGFGETIKTVQRGRNEDAVELASQIYAYANRRNTTNDKLAHKDKPINIIGYSAGGQTVNEALEILARMKSTTRGHASGKDILDRINVVNIATPDFGLVDKPVSNYRNIWADKDPFNILPKTKEKWVTSVPGHEVEDYLRSQDVKDQIRQAFGFYKNSSNARERARVRRKRKDTNEGIYYYSRLDALVEAVKCKTGKPCGRICIPKKATCRKSGSGLGSPNSDKFEGARREIEGFKKDLEEIRELRKQIAQLKKRGLPPERLPKNGQELEKEAAQVETKFDVSHLAAVGAIAGASLLAAPPAVYMGYRSIYHMNFKNSAKEAQEMASKMAEEVPKDLKGGIRGTGGEPADQITFVVGGFAGQGGQNSIQYATQFAPNKGSSLYNNLKEGAEDKEDSPDLFENHHVVAIDNREFEIRPAGQREKFSIGIPGLGELTDGNAEQFRVMLNSALVQGKNPVAVQMAAKAYAFHKQHPDKPINLLGYSAGGMVVHEAHQILHEMGVKNVRTASFGSPYWGLTDKVGPSITFASKNDPAISQAGVAVRDPVMVNKVANHFAYLQTPEVRRHLKNLFDGKPPKTEPIWVPNLTKEPPETPNPMTPGSAKKKKPDPQPSSDPPQSEEEKQREARRKQREAREKKRSDPNYQAEVQRKMEERQRRQQAGRA